MKVITGFSRLISRIQPRPSEKASATRHWLSIRARLRQEFRLRKFLIVGSHSRGTAIRSYSDVDYFAVFARDDARWGGSYVRSSSLLDRVREALSDRFKDTVVSRDKQAVVVCFQRGKTRVDVVPSVFLGIVERRPLYLIPDGSGGWIRTSPQHQNNYIRRANRASGLKLRKVAQMLKFWRECRSPRIPLLSFHIEMLLAASSICKGAKSYPHCLLELFYTLVTRECRALQDPTGISGYITAASTQPQREAVFRAAQHSLEHATSAVHAKSVGNVREAVRQWNIVFNGAFPA